MKVTVGGVVVEQPFSLADKFDEVVKQTNEMVESKNRQLRRSKPMKSMVAVLGLLTTLGYSSVAKAEGLDGVEAKGIQGVISHLADHFKEKFSPHHLSDKIMRKDSTMWQMNDWMKDTLLNTQDFFDSSEILQFFNIIWHICMSFVVLIVGKKGFDMVKARVLGTTTLGASELIIRLLACVVMTFLSLDIMQAGIHASNLVVKTLFKAVESNLVPYDVLSKTGGINVVFWFIGFAFMTVILSVQYWVRQITVTILGVLSPIATMSWVADGGAMLGTLIREFITLITTPIAHGVILTLGTVIIRELIPHTGHDWIDGFNIVMIGFSTMFLMVCTPTFLRKFITGSHNPVKWATSMSKGAVGTVTRVAKFVKK